jgi:tetratricopeptide (TPR) repeat protein
MAALAANRLRGHDAAEPLLLDALEAAAALGDTRQEAKIAYSLGGLESARGNVDRARSLLHHAQQLAGQIGDARQEGIILAALGVLAATFGDSTDARVLYHEAANHCAAAGDSRTLATIRMNLANLDMLDGRVADAEAGYQAVLAEYRTRDDKEGLALVMVNIVHLFAKQGRRDEAYSAAMEAADLAELSGDRGVRASAQCAAALLALQAGARPQAEELWQSGCADLLEMGQFPRLQFETGSMVALCERLGCAPLGLN